MRSADPLRVAAFASGRGSNLNAILTEIENHRLNAEVVGVISNNADAGALELARERDIPAEHLVKSAFISRDAFVQAILDRLTAWKTDLVVLAGYMKKMPPEVVSAYRNRMLNIHPALLPSFGGKGLYGHHVHEAVLEYGCKVSGATVHLVDAEYDTGPPVVQKCVPVLEDDTPESLAARVLMVEHEIFPLAVSYFAAGRVEINGRRVRILSASYS